MVRSKDPATALRTLSEQGAVECLSAGELVAHATTSLLGIGADPTNPYAVAKLDHLKQRAGGRGYVHVVDAASHAEGWIAGDTWRRLLRPSFPSPVTWVFKAGDDAPPTTRGPGDTIAIRLDAHPCVIALCRGLGHPMISTSLNAAGEPPITHVEAVPPTLARHLAGAHVMGPQPIGLPSTVVSVVGSDWRILRQGAVSAEAFQAAWADQS